jgi:hypothetical protein
VRNNAAANVAALFRAAHVALPLRFDTANVGDEASPSQSNLAPANLVDDAHASRAGAIIVSGSRDRRQTHHQPPKSAIDRAPAPRPKLVCPAREPISTFSAHGQAMLDPCSIKAATAIEAEPSNGVSLNLCG